MQFTAPLNEGVFASFATLIKLRWSARKILLFPHRRVVSLLADHSAALRGRGMNFAEVRNYQYGDDIRHMDWRVTARTGRPHTKVYQEERERPVFILVDLGPSMFFGTQRVFKSVLAVKTAALLAWAVAAQGDRVGGFVFSGKHSFEVRPRNRIAGVTALIKALIQGQQKYRQFSTKADASNDSLAHILRQLNRILRPGSLVFLLSDFVSWSPEAELYLKQITQHSEVIAGFIYDCLEKDPPPPQQYLMTNGVNTLSIDTRSKQFCRMYQQLFLTRQQQLNTVLKKNHVPLLYLSTRDLLESALFQQLNRL